MRILLIGPDHEGGSLPPYLDVLARGLRGLGTEVDRLGSGGVPYDTAVGGFWPAERISAEADALLEGADLAAYDLLSVHFGNHEVEQLLPARWVGRQRPPTVYHVHSLAWTLFREHVPSPDLLREVYDGIHAMDAFVCFGSYAASSIAELGAPGALALVSYLPTTIPDGTPVPELVSGSASVPLASLYGYPAPWKDVAGLLEAFRLMRNPLRFVLAGPYWDDPDQVGVVLARGTARYGPVELTVRPRYMGVADRVMLAAESDLAVFPYQPIRTFQGSGAIADYLAHGVPVLATGVANMAELVGPAGRVVPPGDPAALAAELDRFAADPGHRAALDAAAAERAGLFQPLAHAKACLGFYREVLKRV